MKKSVIICLVSGFLCIAVGIAMIIASFSMGVGERINNAIEGASTGNLVELNESYDSINSINFEVSAANLEVKVGDEFSINYSKQADADFKTYVNDGVWYIEGSQFENKFHFTNIFSWFKNVEQQTIYITVPAQAVFDDVSIRVDAGNLEWGNINCTNLSVELNAGNIELEKVNAEGNIVLNCEAGNIEIGAGSAYEVHISSDLGNVEWRGDVEKNISAESNMGNVSLYLAGDEEDYNIYAEANLGNISLNDKEYAGVENSLNINNSAEKTINAESNLGNVEIFINK